MSKIKTIKEAIILRNDKRIINKKVDSILYLVKKQLDNIIIYNLANTEFHILATLNCSVMNSTIKINNVRDYKDFTIDISEVQDGVIDRIEDFITNYCNDNNLKFESEGNYNSATSWLNGKKFDIMLKE